MLLLAVDALPFWSRTLCPAPVAGQISQMLRGRLRLLRRQLVADVDQHAGIARQQPIVRARAVEPPAGEVGRRQSPLGEILGPYLEADATAVRGRERLDPGFQTPSSASPGGASASRPNCLLI